eukprot:TRINITY_DN7407_c0_g1_i2.p1 TRINITY_DN7407_c0_g1~~TRINITY_DN7407_c0_g1_i2.p1  ORF type:complete len:150 (-),score=34.22 TRINITY_DN7407_c0_g1_i2:149-598(-)
MMKVCGELAQHMNRDEKASEYMARRLHAYEPPAEHQHQMLTDFDRRVWEAVHPDQPFTQTAGGDEDDEIQMTAQGPRSTMCQLSQMEFEEPVKIRACGHTFSKAPLTAFIGRSGSKGCPKIGCNAMVRLGDWTRDTEMERQLRREKAHR